MPIADSNKNEIIITRIFNAPREIVWKAWTVPAQIEKWWGPKGFTTKVLEMNLKPGGKWRYIMIGPDGKEYPAEGIISEVIEYEKIVTTDEFGEDFKKTTNIDLPKGIVVTTLFENLGDKTKLTLKIMHPTVEDREKHEKMGVVQGWNSSIDCLDEYLLELMKRVN